MVTKTQLMFVSLYVRDLAVSRRFYDDVLGLYALDPDRASVSYRLGHAVVTLQQAADPAILQDEARDRSITLTLLVDDVLAARATLEDRGARLRSTQTSPAGAMVDFYDPDGHWFSLYEPSEAALGWPSGRKISALRHAGVEHREMSGGRDGLGDPELLYVFLYVDDLRATEAFYRGTLGLEPMEVSACRRGMSNVADGVVKYDGGGVLLTTHHVGEPDHAALHKVTTDGSDGVALGFYTTDLSASAAELSSRGLVFTGQPIESPIGATAAFLDPGGHRYYLCEPSADTMALPRGAVIRRIFCSDL
jgi:catechol 2,3-dioxygenase-like lactoylglutathione lyase family enzyme